MKILSLKTITYRYCARLLSGMVLLYLHPAASVAQKTEDFELWSNLSESMGLITEMEFQVDKADRGEWLVRLGVIGGIAPGYSGSDEYELSYAPNLHIVWNDFLFLKGRKLGVQLFNGQYFYGGAFVKYNGGRSEDNDGLEGLGDISRTFSSGAYLNFRYQGFRLKTEVQHDFFNEGHGTLAKVGIGSRLPWNDPLFYLGLETTWASAEYMRSFFGITPQQSRQSGLAVYEAGAGLRDVSLNLSSAYAFTTHWSLSGQVQYQLLLGDAADSPIVDDVGSRHNFVFGLGLNYTF